MPEFTTEQLIESMQTWKPAPDLAERLLARLNRKEIDPAFQKALSAALAQCARSTYDYIQYIHDFSTVKELNGKNLATQVAHWAFLIQDLKAQAKAYGEAFQKYNAAVEPRLQKDSFDTHYYDAILGLDVRETLKGILGEVEVVLQSMALTSPELSGVDGLALYEIGVRFQLFLQYLQIQAKFNVEELWSVLFDLYNLLQEVEHPSEEPAPEDLEQLHERVRKYKSN
jgi:hypothetical protein